jgi:hypothetical protein
MSLLKTPEVDTRRESGMTLIVFALATLAVTWTAWLGAAAWGYRAGSWLFAPGGPAFLLGVFAPALVALALTAHSEGRSGVRALLARIGKWKVSAGWYLFALGYMAAIKLAAALVHRIATGRRGQPAARDAQTRLRQQHDRHRAGGAAEGRSPLLSRGLRGGLGHGRHLVAGGRAAPVANAEGRCPPDARPGAALPRPGGPLEAFAGDTAPKRRMIPPEVIRSGRADPPQALLLMFVVLALACADRLTPSRAATVLRHSKAFLSGAPESQPVFDGVTSLRPGTGMRPADSRDPDTCIADFTYHWPADSRAPEGPRPELKASVVLRRFGNSWGVDDERSRALVPSWPQLPGSPNTLWPKAPTRP